MARTQMQYLLTSLFSSCASRVVASAWARCFSETRASVRVVPNYTTTPTSISLLLVFYSAFSPRLAAFYIFHLANPLSPMHRLDAVSPHLAHRASTACLACTYVPANRLATCLPTIIILLPSPRISVSNLTPVPRLVSLPPVLPVPSHCSSPSLQSSLA